MWWILTLNFVIKIKSNFCSVLNNTKIKKIRVLWHVSGTLFIFKINTKKSPNIVEKYAYYDFFKHQNSFCFARSWLILFLACERPPTSIANGRHSSGNPPYFINDTVVYICEDGFAPVALDFLTMQCEATSSSAKWAINEERLATVCQPGKKQI